MNAECSCLATNNAMLRGEGPSGSGTTEDCNGSHTVPNSAAFGGRGKGYEGHEAVLKFREGDSAAIIVANA